MKIARTIEEVRKAVAQARQAGRTVGLVPTMGALHAGHLSLIDAAREGTGFVVVSIFANPTQFGPQEDLAAYPATPEQDIAACRRRGVDLVFMPSVEEMYGGGGLTEVRVSQLTETLCGASRPGHFAGVCTVCAKLFNIVQPDSAYFGAKDYQQVKVIERMVADLDFPLEIIVCPTVREPDGLAKSSRNAYLDAGQRRQAAALYGALKLAEGMILKSRPPADEVIEAMRKHIAAGAPAGETDYVRIVDPETLRDVETTDRSVLVALAVKIGPARLIDNLVVAGPCGAA